MDNIYLSIFFSVLDIVLMGCIVYWILKLILQNEKMIFVINAIILFFVIYGISIVFNLKVLHSFLSIFFSWGILLLFIIFQTEIRTSLEKLGDLKRKDTNSNSKVGFVEDITETIFKMADEKTGALITFEMLVPLSNYTSKAVPIDAQYSSQLLMSIFNKDSPLHDGAVVIKNERIMYAATYYPIEIDINLDKKYGTRHRAAISISKETDAITVIVSEETGKVSIAYKENLYTNLEYDFVVEYLKNKLEVKGG